MDYIVRNTVGEKLRALKEDFLSIEKANLREIERAGRSEEGENLARLIETNALRFVREKMLTLSVLDPAMGSGHFLVNATNLISNFITEFLNGLEIEGETPTGTAYWRRWVVENCVYGVDLNPLAAELAKLSLWILSMAKEQPLSFMNHHLKCGNSLIGARLEEIGNYPFSTKEKEPKQLNMFERDPDFRTAVEDALAKSRLIASHASTSLADVEEKKTWLAEIEEDLKGYKAICDVHTDLYSEKGIDENEYRSILQKRDYEKAKNLTKFSKHFHWELEFPEIFLISLTDQWNKKQATGFDVVVGNPPYLGEKGNKEVFRSISQSPWGSIYYRRKMDLFYFFFHLALDLIKEKAQFSFITTNYYLTADGAAFLRSVLHEQATIIQLANFQGLRIFPSASGQHNIISQFMKGRRTDIDANILLSSHQGDADERLFNNIIDGKETQTEALTVAQSSLFEGEEKFIRLHGVTKKNKGFGSHTSIFEKIDRLSKPLANYTESVFMGVQTGCDVVTESLIQSAIEKGFIEKPSMKDYEVGGGIFVLSKDEIENLHLAQEEIDACIKPFYKNSEIQRFYTLPNNSRYLIYVDSSININSFPGIKKHLSHYRPLLAAREQAVTEERNWFWIRGAKRESYFYRPDYIIVPYRSKTSKFSLCHQDIFGAGDVYYVSPLKDLSTKVILGYLNSKLVFYHLYFRGKRKGEMLEYYKTPLENIPINKGLFNNEVNNQVEVLVDQVINIKKQMTSDSTEIEQEIDNLIFDLFELSQDEINKINNLIPE